MLMLDLGHSPDEVADTLGVDHTTVYCYAHTFRKVGLKGYLGTTYRGWSGKLDAQQLMALRGELRARFYTAAAVADWVKGTFGVSYHHQALVKVLFLSHNFRSGVLLFVHPAKNALN